ncbi:hypothetical protein NL108_008267 [Boleophthalmus pectinirostris]|uniref:complement C1q-like protein 4 n=1 Tax=Boleophthalmus pectinirostris TaxID=150288 RepID=UPI00242A6364|nr:complement C1q-like protein 4 [Boleophthalmus pectinirostris]KAJ0069473.1 hypothetical protein NL108_008267 [Boleophthalmus pectinirostris]
MGAGQTTTAVESSSVPRSIQDELAEQRKVLDKLLNLIQAQNAELKSLKKQVEFLTRDRTVRQVAFSAALLESGEQFFGPYNTDKTLVFKHVTINSGNAYNKITGIFTAPVRGVYHFEIFAHCSRGLPAEAYLMKNGRGIFMAHESSTSGSTTAGNAVSLLLEAEDVVYVVLTANNTLKDNEHHHTTFSGHLLFTM